MIFNQIFVFEKVKFIFNEHLHSAVHCCFVQKQAYQAFHVPIRIQPQYAYNDELQRRATFLSHKPSRNTSPHAVTTGALENVPHPRVHKKLLAFSHCRLQLLWLLDFFAAFFFSSNFCANLSFEPFVDVSHTGFISSLHQMNQIWEYACEEDGENSPAEVTLCSIIAPALLYIHQSAVSYLGQLCPQVFRRPQGTRYFGARPFLPPLPYVSLLSQKWLVLLKHCPEVNVWSCSTNVIIIAQNKAQSHEH